MYAKKPWIEKYRPQTIDKVALSVQNRTIYKNIMKTNYFPHMLLYGSPGTGKTTFIINMIKEFNKNNECRNIIHLNASDDRGIDVIRNQIYTFISTQDITTTEDSLKFVVLDEVDYMTKSAQMLLKSLFKIFKNVRFCLVCNYISKIIPSIQNLCMKMFFMNTEINEVKMMLNDICKQENMNVSHLTINNIIQSSYPDIRNMVNLLQLYVECRKDKKSSSSVSAISTIKQVTTSEIECHLQTILDSKDLNLGIKLVTGMLKKQNISFHDYIRLIIKFCINTNMDIDTKQILQELYRDNFNNDESKIKYFVNCVVPKLKSIKQSSM